MILGPDDPRAITDPDELAEARANTERFNRQVLGIEPLTPAQQRRKDRKLAKILRDIGWVDDKDPA